MEVSDPNTDMNGSVTIKAPDNVLAKPKTKIIKKEPLKHDASSAKNTVKRESALDRRKIQKNKLDVKHKNERLNETRTNQGIIDYINDAINLNEILIDPKTKLEILDDSSGFSIVYKVISFILGYEREFLIKVMIIIEDHIEYQSLDLYDNRDEGIEKHIMRLSAFVNEGRLQCDAYIKTACEITGGNNAICPRILNLSWYDHATSIKLMDSISKNQEYNYHLDYSLNWFMDNVERKPLSKIFKIGIVAMDLVKDTVNSSDIELTDERRDRISAKLLMLFCRLSKIHLDLSLTNVLFTETEAYVIDYGRLFLFENLFDNVPDTTPVDMHGRFTKGGFFTSYNTLQSKLDSPETREHSELITDFAVFLHNSYNTMGNITKDLKKMVQQLKGIQVALLMDQYNEYQKITMIKQIIYFMNITDYIYNRGSRQKNRMFDFLSPQRGVDVNVDVYVYNLNKRFVKILEQFKSISQTCGQIDNDSKVCEVNEYCDELTGMCYFTYKLKKYFGLTAGGRKKSIKLRSHARHNKTRSVGKKVGRRKR